MKTLSRLKTYILYIGIFLLPIFFLPTFQDIFGLPKLVLLIFVSLTFILLKAIDIFLKSQVELPGGKFDIPVLGLMAAYLVAGLTQTPNKMEAFLFPGTASVILVGGLLYFLINDLGSDAKRKIKIPLFLGSLVLAIVSIFSTTGLLSSMRSLPPALTGGNFSPLGDYINTAIYLSVSLILGISLVLREKEVANKLFFSVSSLIILTGLLLSIINVLPGKKGSVSVVDFQSSQGIAFDALKINPLLGIGPGNYLTAFNKFRPISFNASPLWSAKFNAARSFYLTALTEAGLLAGASLAYLTYLVIRRTRLDLKRYTFLCLLILMGSMVVFPPNAVTITLFFILLALNTETKVTKMNLGANDTKAPSAIAAILLFVLAIIVFLNGGKVILAEAKYKTALNYLTQNKGKETYESLQGVINESPYVDRYHTTYSQVNLLLAQGLATKEDLSEEDRKLMAELIQQAIREAKSAVFLNSQRASNWELLASTYRAIMAFSQGGDQFAIQSYQQAINLDPINPNPRISLGGVYYALGNYDDAIDAFKLATLAKPDHANAHYNLSAAYREKGDLQKAIDEIKIVLSLVPQDSEDYKAAQKELENLESRKTNAEPEEGGSLTPPVERESAINPPLTLPQEATPPATSQ